MSASRILLVVVLAAVASVGATRVRAQPDSVRTAILKEKGLPLDHTPRGALWRGAAVPGWGQFYNRQYYKMPFVYAGLAGMGFLLNRSISRYKLFKRANLFFVGQQRAGEGEENEYAQFESEFGRASEFFRGEPTGRQLRDQRDNFRRQRVLSILGVGLLYGLTLLDAYVSAHLLTFDVDDDLAVTVRPVGPFSPRARGMGDTGFSVEPSSADGVGVRVGVSF